MSHTTIANIATVDEAAEMFGFNRHTLICHIHKGNVPARKIGRTWIVDLVTSEGERGVMENMQRKQREADAMFASLIAHMNDAVPESERVRVKALETPAWL